MSSVRPPLTRYLSSLSRTDLRATTEISWSAPREYDVGKAAGVKSAALMPTEEDGRSGWEADSATESANGTFFANSCWISFSSSGKVKTDRQSDAFHSSFGSTFEAVAQVDISGVNIARPLTFAAWPSASPFVVYSSEETCGW